MTDELISKKDVLAQTGISYGQLYRWKRMGLIPEAWFIRRSTFTGQETFFPRERILARISQIQALKEERSLDELASLLSPEAKPEGVSWDDPGRLALIGNEGRSLLWKDGTYTFGELVALAAGAEALRRGLQPQEAAALVGLLRREGEAIQSPAGMTAAVAEKTLDREGVSVRVSFAVLGRDPLRFDHESRIKHQADLEKLVGEVKLALGEVS